MAERIYFQKEGFDYNFAMTNGVNFDDALNKHYVYKHNIPKEVQLYLESIEPAKAAAMEVNGIKGLINDQMKPREVKTTSSPQTNNAPTPVPSFATTTTTPTKSVQEVNPFNKNKSASNQFPQPKPAEPKKEEKDFRYDFADGSMDPSATEDKDEEIVFKKSRPKTNRALKTKIRKHFDIEAEIVQDLQFIATHYHLGMTGALKKIIQSQKLLIEENMENKAGDKKELLNYQKMMPNILDRMAVLEDEVSKIDKLKSQLEVCKHQIKSLEDEQTNFSDQLKNLKFYFKKYIGRVFVNLKDRVEGKWGTYLEELNKDFPTENEVKMKRGE